MNVKDEEAVPEVERGRNAPNDHVAVAAETTMMITKSQTDMKMVTMKNPAEAAVDLEVHHRNQRQDLEHLMRTTVDLEDHFRNQRRDLEHLMKTAVDLEVHLRNQKRDLEHLMKTALKMRGDNDQRVGAQENALGVEAVIPIPRMKREMAQEVEAEVDLRKREHRDPVLDHIARKVFLPGLENMN